MSPARWILPLLLMAASSSAAQSRFEGPAWIPSPRDSAGFAAVSRARAEIDQRAAAIPGDARTRARESAVLVRSADSLAAVFGARLASRAPVDSIAIAQLLLLRHDLRMPALGMVDSITRELLWEGVHLLERRIGEEHPGMLPALARLSVGYERTQNLRRMVAVDTRRVTLLGSLEPPDSLALANALGSRCRGRTGLGDYDEAEEDGRRALGIRERHLGSGHLLVAQTLSDIAVVLTRRSQVPEALASYERVLSIRRAQLEGTHPLVAQTLFNIGAMEMRQDRYAESRAHVLEAVRIWERPENNTDSNVGAGYMALGEIGRRLGEYEEARGWLERGLVVRRRSLAPNSPGVASALDNLAGLLEEMGDYAAALPRREESLRIRERAQGDGSPDYAQSLDALARLHLAMDRAREAMAMSERAVAIRERSMGSADPGLVRLLNTLGDARRALDDPKGALADYRRAERIQAASSTAATADRATILRRVGQAQLALEQPASAESSFTEALAVTRRALGQSHPLAIDLLDDLAHAQRDRGAVREALATALEAERRGRERFALQAPALSEREALRYGEVRPSGLPLAIGLAASGADPARVAEVWGALAHQRGQVLDEISERRRALRRAETPEVDSLRAEFAEASRRLGSVLARGSAGDPAWDARAAEARRHLERSEASLGARSRAFRDERRREALGFESIAASLPRGTALVAFTRYALTRWQDGRRSLDDRIAAFVLRAGGEPEVVGIGETARVDSLCRAWRAEMRPPARGEGATAREQRALEAGRELRRLVWDPVAARVGPVKRLFVVPEGELHLVNLAALPGEGDRYLVEAGLEFHVMAGERDLLMAPATGGRGMLALGGASFDASDVAAPPGELLAAVPAAAPTWRGPLAACESFRDLSFAPLPATRAEAEEVAAMWAGARDDVVRLEGAQASEAAVKRLAPGRRIVHLATHGFFVDPTCGSGEGGGRGIGGLAASDTNAVSEAGRPFAAATERAPDGLENPLRLSGLALAGANLRRDSPEGAEDGILTAEELAALDLTGVEWVVLSACETGVGSLGAGEGVFGLRRALHTAGAHTLISSLWSVEDASASRWMEALYRRRLRQREDTVASVHGADRDELARRRRAGESTHPFHWAGFVAAGDWR